MKVEFTQHTGNEMYHPHLNGFNKDWRGDEKGGPDRPKLPKDSCGAGIGRSSDVRGYLRGGDSGSAGS
jgi:hypothetical protein